MCRAGLLPLVVCIGSLVNFGSARACKGSVDGGHVDVEPLCHDNIKRTQKYKLALVKITTTFPSLVSDCGMFKDVE